MSIDELHLTVEILEASGNYCFNLFSADNLAPGASSHLRLIIHSNLDEYVFT